MMAVVLMAAVVMVAMVVVMVVGMVVRYCFSPRNEQIPFPVINQPLGITLFFITLFEAQLAFKVSVLVGNVGAILFVEVNVIGAVFFLAERDQVGYFSTFVCDS